MILITKDIHELLIQNAKKQEEAALKDECIDFEPVLKLFTPDAGCTWLITELDPEYPDIAFGLCDLGMGFPELGNVSLSELRSVQGKLGMPIERDRHFKAKHPISVYAHAARREQAITEDPDKLERASYQLAQKKERRNA